MLHNITSDNININASVTPHQALPDHCQTLGSSYRIFRDHPINYDFNCAFEDNLRNHPDFNCLDEGTAKGVVNAVKHLDNRNYHLRNIINNLCCITATGWHQLLDICNNKVSHIKGSINQEIERCKRITMALNNRTILSKSEIQRCEERAKSSIDYNNNSISSKTDQINDLLSQYVSLKATGTPRALDQLTKDTLACFDAKQVLKADLDKCEKKAGRLNLIDQEYQRKNNDAENKAFLNFSIIDQEYQRKNNDAENKAFLNFSIIDQG